MGIEGTSFLIATAKVSQRFPGLDHRSVAHLL